MEDNWDLHAVVRGCATIASTTSSVSSSSVSSVFSSTSSSSLSSSSSSCGFLSTMILPNTITTTSQQKSNQVFSFSNNPFEARNSIDEELHELCKPFFLKSQPKNNNHFHQTFSSCSSSTLSSSSSFSYSSSPNSVQPQQKQSSKHFHHASSAATTPRSKRRKNQLKKVCQVSAENLSSDIWAWRKYGQKPIKGSPYPRGYYRCSSSKGCLARKQVERNRTDPTMFIVTYTGEHNHPAPTHRNSLAGSTRQKPQISANEDSENKTLMVTKQASPSTSCVEEEEQKSESELEDNMEDFLMNMSNDDDNDNNENTNDVFGSPDMEISDDFFEGLDELTVVSSSSSAECFSVSAIPSLVAK